MFEFKDKKHISILVSWTLVLLWMLLIFNLSAQPAQQSDRLSGGITQIVIKVVQKIVPGSNPDLSSFNHIVRKNAHFFAYLVLGILALNALRRSGVSGKGWPLLALCICAVYASSDEFHQLFVPGRSGQVKDVLIDSSGALLGIVLSLTVSKLKCKRKNSMYLLKV